MKRRLWWRDCNRFRGIHSTEGIARRGLIKHMLSHTQTHTRSHAQTFTSVKSVCGCGCVVVGGGGGADGRCQCEAHLNLLRLSAADREQSATLWTGGTFSGSGGNQSTSFYYIHICTQSSRASEPLKIYPLFFFQTIQIHLSMILISLSFLELLCVCLSPRQRRDWGAETRFKSVISN